MDQNTDQHQEVSQKKEVTGPIQQHPADLADQLRAIEEPGERLQFLLAQEKELAASTFSHLEAAEQIELLELMRDADLAWILHELPSDERSDLFARVPPERRDVLIPKLSGEVKDSLIKLSSYPERSAGAVMSTEFLAFPGQVTAAEALSKIRQEAYKQESIYNTYVVDDHKKILGVVSLRDIIVAEPQETLASFMTTDVVSANVLESQEEVARMMAKYDLLAIPITNGGDRIVGIVTHDDVIDIIHREATEDVQKLMAMSPYPEGYTYLSTPSLGHFRRRVGWVVGLAAAGLISGSIIHSYEGALASMMILALYMPMVADTGGNTGSQSATVVVRALALGEITARDAAKVFFKEFKVAVLLSLVLGFLAYLKVMYLSRGSDLPAGFTLSNIGIAISVALAIQVVTATLIGALLPMTAHKLKMDPAVVASPALTTVVDITGLLIYFNVAKWILGFGS